LKEIQQINPASTKVLTLVHEGDYI